MEKKTIIIIGSGFAGLAAACCLAKEGFRVHILEKNAAPGGRARQFEAKGFSFDMGPSWYWMPDVFENFFSKFNYSPKDFFELKRLSPSYSVIFSKDEKWDIPCSFEAIKELFEKQESGGGLKLEEYIQDARHKYEVGMKDLVHQPCLSAYEFLDYRMLKGLFSLNLFGSLKKHARKHFKNNKLLNIIEFPSLFLGASPEKTPALYSMMNYADMIGGTWYPKGGMVKIIDALCSLAQELGATIHLNTEARRIEVINNRAVCVHTANESFACDAVLGAADYQHVEQKLLSAPYRQYSQTYWNSRTLAPSALIFYLGVNKKLDNLQHHTLFFDKELTAHTETIYSKPRWPEAPLFYLCCPSRTDDTVAPAGMENLFILMPAAPDLEDSGEIRNRYFGMLLSRIEELTGENISDHIVYKRSYAHKNFITDYNAFKGNAYGLANTLGQTALLKPRLKSKYVDNLFFAGQLTVPGPGMPPALISGQITAGLIAKAFQKTKVKA
ncbi:MAG: phytoene desaturase family protein [Cytophagales bacterium]|nr:phytoene desaturase family protein [Cytophagales bacterium]